MLKLRKLKYQLKAVRKIEHFNGRCLLADEMGLGKTIEVLLWVKKHPDRVPVVVVCPASLKWMWANYVHDILKIRCEVLQGRNPSKRALIGRHNFIILNYEILQYWVKSLKKLKPKILLLDECHYQKSIDAKRTEAVWKLGKKIPHIIAISGTPLTNRPAELWTTLRLLRPKVFGSMFVYGHRYCKPTMKWGKTQYKGAAHLAELHRRLSSTLMIRRLKKDVLTELLDKTRHVIPLDIKRKEYDKARTNFIKWLTIKSPHKAKRAAKAKKLVMMGYLKRLAAELKMEGVLDWVDDFLEGSDGKLVLFCVHKKIVKQLHQRYKHISVVVDGSVSGRKRQLAVSNFQNNKKIRIFIGNIRAAGVGITLTAASTLAFVEMDWTPGDHTQAEDRIHRIGQKNAASIYYLIAKDTIEENLCKLIQKKQKILASTLDGTGKDNQLNVWDELEKALRRKK